MLSGCVSSIASEPSNPSDVVPFKTKGERHRSWMLPEAKQRTLLYVSTEDYGVYVLTYPKGKVVGMLYDLASSEGLCSDSAGDVFVNDSVGQAVVEFAHASVTPIRRLTNGSEFHPYGCAVDPLTGNLAATNQDSGAILIFKKAKTYLETIFDPGSFMWYCAYDLKGNLFTDRHNHHHNTFIGELPHGAKAFKNLKLNKFVLALSGMRWNGKYLSVGNLESNAVYQVRVSSSTATIVGTTKLTTASNVLQYWFDHGQLLNPDPSSGTVGVWNYPSGGQPVRTIEYYAGANGVTISRP